MATPVQMPKQGNTVEECLLVEWRCKEGDAVKTGQVLCAIETDKASFEVESPADGTILKLFWKEGELVPVLTNITVIGNPGEDISAFAPEGAATPAAAPEAKKAEAPAPKAAPAPTAPTTPAAQNVAQTADSPVSPRARNLAEKLGVNASALTGSGPHGRVVASDVQAAADAGLRMTPLAKATAADQGLVAGHGTGLGGRVRARDLTVPGKAIAAVAEEAPTELQYKGIRKLIGDRMLQSLTNHAQLTENSSADASAFLAYRQSVKEMGESLGLPNISLNDMICWTVAQTLPLFPDLNAIADFAAGKYTQYRQVHLGVAIDTPRGLMVPVIKNAHRLSLVEMAETIAKYAADCRKGSIDPALLSGGTFTITNLGSLGIDSFTPVLNSPQVGILGVCSVKETPIPDGKGGVAFQPRMGLSLTIDHRIVDGAPAARFLKALADNIANFSRTLSLYGAWAR